MLTNMAAEINRHLNIKPLKIHSLEALPLQFTTRINITQRKSHEREIDLTSKTPVNMVIANNYINLYVY